MFTLISTKLTRKLTLVVALCVFIAVGAAPLSAGAVTATTKSTAHVSDATWENLAAQAERDGHVPVIIEMDTKGVPQRTKDERRVNFTKLRDDVLAQLEGKHVRALKALPGAPFLSLHADAEDLGRLRRSPHVLSVVRDEVHESLGTTSNGAQAGVQIKPNWWDYSRIGANWANDNGYNGSGRSIVVIDSGVAASHQWLTGRVKTQACFATNKNGTGACPNGRYYQYNSTDAGVAGAAAPCTYHTSCAHGTHVAHTAAGKYGVARGARIVAIQASHKEWSTKAQAYVPVFADSDIANALWYVHDPLPFVPAAVNMSIGGGGYTSSCDSENTTVTSWINKLKANYGIATVVASGNDDYIDGIAWPACISTAISVGNTTLDTLGRDAVLGYTQGGSNSSSSLDLLAPGTDICSAVPVGLDTRDAVKDGQACDWFGTSMAAPHVAGAIAILKASRPTATVDQMVSALHRNGVSILDSRNNITRTRINVANAVYYF